MKYRALGRTGLEVSELSQGTVSLGIDYGIRAPSDFGRPTEKEAIALIRSAVNNGITLIDTAPAYGDAERIVGLAVGGDSQVLVATKIAPAAVQAADPEAIEASLESSLVALRRKRLDIVQVPNATQEMIEDSAVTRVLVKAKDAGVVRLLGATVYKESAALAVIRSRVYDVVQIAFNVLDQRKLRQIVPEAHAAGVAVIVRSAFLKGVLTRKAEHLPEELSALRERAEEARDRLADGDWERLTEMAMRFCLSEPRVSTVLTGARTVEELSASLVAEAAGPLDAEMMRLATSLKIEDDDDLLDPSRWRSIP
jgi:aryl-alcohol dehydrogenase-like predicted oxidoreductase